MGAVEMRVVWKTLVYPGSLHFLMIVAAVYLRVEGSLIYLYNKLFFLSPIFAVSSSGVDMT